MTTIRKAETPEDKPPVKDPPPPLADPEPEDDDSDSSAAPGSTTLRMP